jgi:hypothetical protein
LALAREFVFAALALTLAPADESRRHPYVTPNGRLMRPTASLRDETTKDRDEGEQKLRMARSIATFLPLRSAP